MFICMLTNVYIFIFTYIYIYTYINIIYIYIYNTMYMIVFTARQGKKNEDLVASETKSPIPVPGDRKNTQHHQFPKFPYRRCSKVSDLIYHIILKVGFTYMFYYIQTMSYPIISYGKIMSSPSQMRGFADSGLLKTTKTLPFIDSPVMIYPMSFNCPIYPLN